MSDPKRDESDRDAVRGHAVVVQPGGGPSFWQPVPANGHADPTLHPAVTRFEGLSMGYQTVARAGASASTLTAIRSSSRSASGVEDASGGWGEPSPGSRHGLLPRLRRPARVPTRAPTIWSLLWVVSPPGLEHFFEAIGRPRRPGEPAPEPFARPADVVAIERRSGSTTLISRPLAFPGPSA